MGHVRCVDVNHVMNARIAPNKYLSTSISLNELMQSTDGDRSNCGVEAGRKKKTKANYNTIFTFT